MPRKTNQTALPRLTDLEIVLKDLVPHPLNARAQSRDVHEAGDIPILAASIASLGLLNPLIVQKTDEGFWGVLAGGRRLAALRHLRNDRSAKGWTMQSRIPCRSIGEDVAAATAITLAENVTQRAMDPLDEFEAFARMVEAGGHTVETIAATFGVDVRRVTERLRYGRVHPDIRAAARAKEITLDVMKAFASHPDHGTQWAVFEATEGQYRQAWTIRDRLEKAGVKVGSELGRYVEEAYRAADGPIIADLIVEDSVLADEALVERLLVEQLESAAEAERARLGFAWAEGRRTADYEALRSYGRTYPSPIEPEGEAAARAAAIADRLLAIDEARDAAEEADDGTDFDALEDEYLDLQREHEELTTGYTDEQRVQSGVIAHWGYDGVQIVYGLIRPEDVAKAEGETPTAGSAGNGGARPIGADGTDGGDGSTVEDGAAPLDVPASLAADLKTEQAIVLGSAIAGDPALAQDLALFKIVVDLIGGAGTRVSWSLGITARASERLHARLGGIDGRPAAAVAALREGLDLTWWDEARPVAERFEAFRALDADAKSRIVAVAMADAISPTDLGYGEPLLVHIAHQVVPDLRAAWRPTGEAFFGRIKKAQLLHLLATDLKQPEEAARLGTAKKTDIVDYLEKLFAEPFATLTTEQREAVETWCPPGMAIPAPRGRNHAAEVSSEDIEADPDETFDADPDEEFALDEEDVPEPEAA